MVRLSIYYLSWHYTRALSDMAGIWGNFFWFFYTFFSIPLLLGTLFQPFHRLDSGYKKGFYPGAWFEQFGVNMLMRLVGACLRLFLVFIGMVSLGVTLVAGSLFYCVWLLAPLFIAVLVLSGVALLVT